MKGKYELNCIPQRISQNSGKSRVSQWVSGTFEQDVAGSRSLKGH